MLDASQGFDLFGCRPFSCSHHLLVAYGVPSFQGEGSTCLDGPLQRSRGHGFVSCVPHRYSPV
eukprot:365542-Chlamydomonas_euryale.AAC.50